MYELSFDSKKKKIKLQINVTEISPATYYEDELCDWAVHIEYCTIYFSNIDYSDVLGVTTSGLEKGDMQVTYFNPLTEESAHADDAYPSQLLDYLFALMSEEERSVLLDEVTEICNKYL